MYGTEMGTAPHTSPAGVRQSFPASLEGLGPVCASRKGTLQAKGDAHLLVHSLSGDIPSSCLPQPDLPWDSPSSSHPKSVLPRLCLQLSCCQAVSDKKCEYTHVWCCQAENSSVGAFPKTNPGYDDGIVCSLHFSPTLSLNRNKKHKAEHPFPP